MNGIRAAVPAAILALCVIATGCGRNHANATDRERAQILKNEPIMLVRPPGVAPGNIDDLVVNDTGYRDSWTSEGIGVEGGFADVNQDPNTMFVAMINAAIGGGWRSADIRCGASGDTAGFFKDFGDWQAGYVVSVYRHAITYFAVTSVHDAPMPAFSPRPTDPECLAKLGLKSDPVQA